MDKDGLRKKLLLKIHVEWSEMYQAWTALPQTELIARANEIAHLKMIYNKIVDQVAGKNRSGWIDHHLKALCATERPLRGVADAYADGDQFSADTVSAAMFMGAVDEVCVPIERTWQKGQAGP